MSARRGPGILVFTTLLVLYYCRMSQATIQFHDHGYSGIVVDIDPGVAEDATLIEGVKNIMFDASAILLDTTRGRAYFKDVVILIPSHWTGVYPNATWQTVQEKHILVVPSSSGGDANEFRVNQVKGCGEPALDIEFTSEYLKRIGQAGAQYGAAGAYFSDAWSRYRWGVFGRLSEANFSDVNSQEEALTSLHGRLCAGRSMWDVMQQHPDFADAESTLADWQSFDKAPNITIYRKYSRHVIFVLDSTISSEPLTWANLLYSVENVVRYVLTQQDRVTITVYDVDTTIIGDRVPVSNATLLQEALNELHEAILLPGSDRCTTCAIQKVSKLPDTEGAEVVVVVGGHETSSAAVDVASLSDLGTVVHIVSTVPDPDTTIQDVASGTRGSLLYAPRGGMGSDFIDSIASLVSRYSSRYVVYGKAHDIESNETSLDTFRLVTGSTYTAVAVFFYDYQPSVRLTSPSSVIHTKTTNPENFHYRNNTIIIRLNSIQEPGTWTVEITNDENITDSYNMIVLNTFPQDFSVRADILKNSMTFGGNTIEVPGAYVWVTKDGQMPPTADVIWRIENSQLEVTLRDSGSGADVIKHDSLYSGFVPALNGSVLYSVTIQVSLAANAEENRFNCQMSVGFVCTYCTSTVLPPARIQDLKITAMSQDRSQVSLAWTSVGDTLDQGQGATAYIAITGEDAESVQNGSISAAGIERVAVSIPRDSSGQPVSADIQIPESLANKTVFVGMVALSSASLYSDVSNLVLVDFDAPPPGLMPTTEPPPADDAVILGLPRNTFIIVAAAAGSAVALLIIIIVIIVICRSKRPKLRSAKDEEVYGDFDKPRGQIYSLGESPEQSSERQEQHDAYDADDRPTTKTTSPVRASYNPYGSFSYLHNSQPNGPASPENKEKETIPFTNGVHKAGYDNPGMKHEYQGFNGDVFVEAPPNTYAHNDRDRHSAAPGMGNKRLNRYSYDSEAPMRDELYPKAQFSRHPSEGATRLPEITENGRVAPYMRPPHRPNTRPVGDRESDLYEDTPEYDHRDADMSISRSSFYQEIDADPPTSNSRSDEPMSPSDPNFKPSREWFKKPNYLNPL